MFEIADYSNRIKNISEAYEQATGEKLTVSCDDMDKPVSIVFAGQYSAGKSTILKMLTGNSEIATGAGITTQNVHAYEWQGLEIIDTPGIHTQLRPDHDEISYKAIASADLLIFVVTNELFDEHLAQHFRSLLIDKDKGGEMLLVINKMERTSLGNTIEQQEIIKEDLKKVLFPYTPEQLNISFLDAESYLTYLEEKDDDPEMAQYDLERSGYHNFIENLNSFVSRKQLMSKLTTKLYEIDALLERRIKELETPSDDDVVDALEEHYMQQRNALVEARGKIKRDVRDVYNLGVAEIKELGAESSSLITENCNAEEVESKLKEYVIKAEDIIDKTQLKAKNDAEEEMERIDSAIDVILHSEFTTELAARLSAKYDSLPDKVKAIINKTGKSAKAIGDTLVKSAYNSTATTGFKLASFSGGNAHNFILKAGHFFGYKFRPWEAIKMAKGVAVAGQVLGVLGVGVSVFMQIKEDSDKEKLRLAIAADKQAVRSSFNSAANELLDYGNLFITENVEKVLDPSIEVLNNNINEIRATKTKKNSLCSQLEEIQLECRELIAEIHAENVLAA